MASKYLIALTLLFITNYSTALKCYSCDSSAGMTCNYGLLSFTYNSLECEVKSGSSFIDTIASIIPTQCTKIVGKDREGNVYTGRGCAPSTGPVNTCDAIAKIIKFAENKQIESLDCYTCDTDNCNSATKFGGMSILALLIACFIFLF